LYQDISDVELSLTERSLWKRITWWDQSFKNYPERNSREF